MFLKRFIYSIPTYIYTTRDTTSVGTVRRRLVALPEAAQNMYTVLYTESLPSHAMFVMKVTINIINCI